MSEKLKFQSKFFISYTNNEIWKFVMHAETSDKTNFIFLKQQQQQKQGMILIEFVMTSCSLYYSYYLWKHQQSKSRDETYENIA